MTLISRVDFFTSGPYGDWVKLGEDDAAPYGFTWTGVAEGRYALMAKAIDAAGASACSVPVEVIVLNASSPREPDNPPNTIAGLQYWYYEGS